MNITWDLNNMERWRVGYIRMPPKQDGHSNSGFLVIGLDLPVIWMSTIWIPSVIKFDTLRSLPKESFYLLLNPGQADLIRARLLRARTYCFPLMQNLWQIGLGLYSIESAKLSSQIQSVFKTAYIRSFSDLSCMHAQKQISTFFNPLKVHWYQAG